VHTRADAQARPAAAMPATHTNADAQAALAMATPAALAPERLGPRRRPAALASVAGLANAWRAELRHEPCRGMGELL
jgi:hypothetical protein